MSNSIQVFNNDEFSIRTIEENGNIWFVAKDVVQALEYSESTINNSINMLVQSIPEIWKGKKRILTPGGEQEMLCLTEQGLYFFLGRSDKAKAIPYQIWVAGEVIPSIRETGSYSVNKIQASLPSGVLEGAKVIFETAKITGNQLTLALDKIYKSYTGRSALMTADIELKTPVKKQSLTPTEIAEILSIGEGKKGARIVNTLLLNAGYQHKIGKYWEPTELGEPYADMLDINKKYSNGTPIKQVKWYSSILDIVKNLIHELAKAV